MNLSQIDRFLRFFQQTSSQHIFLIMSMNDFKLNSSKDWKQWNWQFILMIIAADFWEIIQNLKVSIQKSAESNINFYSLTSTAAAVQISSQLQAADSQATVAENSQSTVQQKFVDVEFVHFTTAD